jgi:two-component system response regulator CpxR
MAAEESVQPLLYDGVSIETSRLASRECLDTLPVRLLIIDDDRELTSLLGELLAQEGLELDAYHSGQDAAATAVTRGYALIVLDVMLPEKNGFEILKEIRHQSNVPVILLTARGDDVDRVVGLEIGADDYVPKPFNARELTARIRAVLRRADARAMGSDRPVVRVDDVTLDPSSRTVTCASVPVELTTVEFDLECGRQRCPQRRALHAAARHSGRHAHR